ncbi:MAG: Ig-like domain-containing protein [Kofleriaceae bacterium]
MRLVTIVGILALAAPAWAQYHEPPSADGKPLPPRTMAIPGQLAEPPPLLVNSHIIYLNSCRPNGCVVTRDASADDSRTDHSAIVPHSGTLGALSASIDFNAIKQCITTAMAPFNVEVTDVDPGMADHFEIMIAGTASQVGFDPSFLGVAQYLCGGTPGQCSGKYIPNALSFAFGNAQVPGNKVTYLCGTALQETAHGWTLDHATATSDPMTYNNYTTPLAFRDNAPCGSDCLYQCGANTCNSFGVVCSGQTHVCQETGTATQNEIGILTALFGPAGAQAPTIAITDPLTGSAKQVGHAFPINVTCTSGDGVQEIDIQIDGIQVGTFTSSPAMVMTAPNLAMGTHHIKALCGTNKQATATATADVLLGNVCATDTDCPGTGQICYQMACIDGPGAAGGLGSTCTMNSDCTSGQCGSDGDQSLCVIPCDLTQNNCPGGFGCLDAGTGGGGVCWLGANNDGGGCEVRHNTGSRGSILFGLGFAALWITRRRKRA